MIEVSDLRLDIQCQWRFVDGDSILFGRDDLAYPASAAVPVEQFDWEKADSFLDVARREWFDKYRPSLPVVCEVDGDAYGGFRIALAGGFALECFPSGGRRSDDSELWRLFGHRTDGLHFVVTGDGMASYS